MMGIAATVFAFFYVAVIEYPSQECMGVIT